MWNFYSFMLIVYWHQFNRLGPNTSFQEIKRKINRIELFGSIFIAGMILIYFLFTFLTFVLTIFRYECIYYNSERETDYKFDNLEWSNWLSIIRAIFWLQCIGLLLNIPIQIILYWKLRRVMIETLEYFYYQQRFSILLLFVTNLFYHSWVMVSNLALDLSLEEYLFIFYRNIDMDFDWIFMIFWANLSQVLSLYFYAIFATSYINLQEYIKVIMHKKGVFEHFKSMSYLITKSCFSVKDLYDTPIEYINSQTMSDSEETKSF